MTVAPVPGNGLPLFQARRTALVVIKLQLNCYDKGRRELSERGAAKSARSYPLGVKSGHSLTCDQCPLYPQKADMDQHDRDVCFVPKADIALPHSIATVEFAA
jgi:hypothetical protein